MLVIIIMVVCKFFELVYLPLTLTSLHAIIGDYNVM